MVKNPPARAGAAEAGSGSPLRKKWHLLQDSCLGNPVDRGAWRATVHVVSESDATEHALAILYSLIMEVKFISHSHS